jgi:hypothetical protein
LIPPLHLHLSLGTTSTLLVVDEAVRFSKRQRFLPEINHSLPPCKAPSTDNQTPKYHYPTIKVALRHVRRQHLDSLDNLTPHVLFGVALNSRARRGYVFT